MPDEELIREIRKLVEPALITAVALQIQQHKSYDAISFEDAVKIAEAKIAETRKILVNLEV